ncbi:hypothetical protein CLV51_109140 [Chitinophaga niastensis]|uniref:DUF4136 domain-containing protein n=1 Tax=Chitinophaga niastensis TaxID=536980 RepID=A0A2P8HA91_CHINA|nr:hypothetical protein [Chitinophaga niastensis]PSL43146.1 hypothetical protein CLV51_109140 [Chitinophaga niastensis]
MHVIISRVNTHRISFLLLVLMALLLVNCGTTVHMTGTWKAPAVASQGYHEILVTSLSPNVGARQTIETQLAASLKKNGLIAGRSLDIFPPGFNPETSKEVSEKKILAAGYKAVLTVSLINKESERRYVPGSVMYAPYPAYGWYGNFWGYYGYMYGSVYTPGYYTTDKTYFLESNLYDLTQEDKLVWSGQSETYNPNSLESFAVAYAKTVTKALKDAGLIR